MAIIEAMVQELTHEAASTRRMLERVPQQHLGWKPHEKSMTLGRLANHIAGIPKWVVPTIEQEELVFGPSTNEPECDSVHGIVQTFDESVSRATAAMKGRSDAHMMVPWRLKAGSQLIFELPRVAVLRSMILNHLIHHRGQLSVYLRLLNIPVPAVYGPSADEQMPH